jgi:hypothetical protein
MTGAGNEARTRDLNLGKVALYQLSYSRNFAWLGLMCRASRVAEIVIQIPSHFQMSWKNRLNV